MLGAGFGGLELSTRLSEELGEDVEVVLIDQADGFVFGFSKLDVMFGRTTAAAVQHAYRDVLKPGVQFVQSTIRGIDPQARRVETDAGDFEGDVMVVALGADLHPSATPGLVEAGHEFYTVAGAFAGARGARAVRGRARGRRASPRRRSSARPPRARRPCWCTTCSPGAVSGTRSEISLVMPLGRPIPPSPEASEALLDGLRRARHRLAPRADRALAGPGPQVAVLADGDEMPFDLFLGVPVHRAPQVVQDSGLCVDGWIPVDPLTLETAYPDVYAVGDVTSVGTPKAGVYAERQAAVVAERIIARHRENAASSTYDGRGTCYLEFGDDQVANVEVTFRNGQPPSGEFEAPSDLLAADKAEFGSSRIRRWFGREWSNH